VQTGVLAFGADNNVALWDPLVGCEPFCLSVLLYWELEKKAAKKLREDWSLSIRSSPWATFEVSAMALQTKGNPEHIAVISLSLLLATHGNLINLC
jgi:hypothetical protein